MKSTAGQRKILSRIKIKNPFHLLENIFDSNIYGHFAQSAKNKSITDNQLLSRYVTETTKSVSI